jgi:hypothetical protein
MKSLHRNLTRWLADAQPVRTNRIEVAKRVATALSELEKHPDVGGPATAFVMASLAHEGSVAGMVANNTTIKTELVHALRSIDAMAGTDGDPVGKFFARWLREPLRDTLARSTSGSRAGRPVRSAEGQEPVEILQMALLAGMLDPTLLQIRNIDGSGAVQEGMNLNIDGTHLVDVDTPAG